MELVRVEPIKRTIRAYSDRHGNRRLEIVEYDPVPVIQASPKKFSKLEIAYLMGMSLLGFGVGAIGMFVLFAKH